MENETHIVALSGGKDSTAMALRLQEVEPRDYQFCITPTGRELPEMQAHWAKLECLLGKPLLRLPGPSMEEEILRYKTLPNFRMRWCTRRIKIEPFQHYAALHAPAVCYVGLRADESSEREGTDHTGITGVRQDCPLVRWGWDVQDVRSYLSERGVAIPERTDCDCCFYQRIGEWWRLWKLYPERWTEIIALEDLTGHTFRSEQRDSWPAGLRDLGAKFQAGFTPKGADQISLPINVEEREAMCGWCAR